MGFFSAVCTSTARLDGKTAIITGSNTGIGKVTAKDFFERGAKVIMACRNKTKATEAVNDIKDSCKSKQGLGELVVAELDLTSLKSVRNCAKTIMDQESRIDLLVNNAGVMTCPESRTADGYEMQFGTNHLGHFLFTLLLLPKIVQSPSARIVNVSSRAHEAGTIDFNDLNWNNKPYSALKAYAQSKLANILFTKELARQLADKNINNVTVYSLHPGVIKTELGRHLKDTYGALVTSLWDLLRWAIKTPEQGAQTTIYCSVDEKCATESGLYYAECALKSPTKAAQNEEDAKRLWIESLKLVDLPDNYVPFNKI
ncbi:retinol dehydrogenase 13-like [Euwallacea similis]|uniref:retinol dehydrogenase 13-like n=1 Tax=Euwallacea similis TaxID=1736056 RepID=UPI00344C2069